MFADHLGKITSDAHYSMHKGSPEFVEKLFAMLEDPQTDAFIRWAPTGHSFLILNPPEFARRVLEQHFKHGNLSSFVRQLNKYDFHKIKSTDAVLEMHGSQVWEFRNEYFQRHRRDLMLKIRRKRSTSERSLRNSFDANYGDANAFQNQALSTLKVITRYFQVIIEDISELKAVILQRTKNVLEKIIVCDTDVNGSNYAAQVLNKLGLSTIIAENEDELLIRVETEKFDVYVVGAALRCASSVVRKIKQINPESQIVVLIDSAYKHDSYAFLNLGASEVLIKPYVDETLVHVVNNCIDNKKRGLTWHAYPQE